MGVCEIIRGATAKLKRENSRLTVKLAEEKAKRIELEDAIVELGSLFAEQDDALVELAELIEEV